MLCLCFRNFAPIFHFKPCSFDGGAQECFLAQGILATPLSIALSKEHNS